MEKFLGGVVVAIGVSAFMVAVVLWGGLVLQQVWNWHAYPFTAIKLTLAQAVGLSCLIAVLKGLRRRPDTGEKDAGIKDISYLFIGGGITLLIAYCAHVFA